MHELHKFFPSSAQGKAIQRLLNNSPSPSLTKTYLGRLLEGGGAKSIRKIPAAQLATLLRLLGSSSYLSDVLIRQARAWPELFLRQIKLDKKSVAEHFRDLEPAVKGSISLADFCVALRQHKQREYLRIGARDLLTSVTMEETVRELSALADASLHAAYQYCRGEVEKDFGPLLLPDKKSRNRLVILGMGKLGGEELNFSSDIDVIFLYEDDEGESCGGRRGKTSPREFFSNVGKKIEDYYRRQSGEDGAGAPVKS